LNSAPSVIQTPSIIVVHNHPSGDPMPSSADLIVTTRLKAAGDVLGIALLDHVIVGHEGRYMSFKEQGRL
jgi:DNA repair protein RadC